MSSIKESQELFIACQQAWTRGASAAWAVITAVDGSAYRRPGAKMLVTNDNDMRGSLSGGCLEADLYLQAQEVIGHGQSKVLHYDLAEDATWGLGIGCKGSLDILVLPVRHHDKFWRSFSASLKKSQALVWIHEVPDGQKGLLMADGNRLGDPLPTELWTLAERVIGKHSQLTHLDHRVFFVDPMTPAPRLIICGAGHDARPMVHLAAMAGFEVAVLDPRPHFNHPDRLPGASAHWVQEPHTAGLDVPYASFWLIMNHHRQRDLDSLRVALTKHPRWLGVLGPRRRTEGILDNLGLTFSDAPIVAPPGLDLGAETPEQVALSITAQMLSTLTKRSATPLHGRIRIHSS